MTREQMIAWLTLEGWESVVCSYGSLYARRPHTQTFMHIGAYAPAPHKYGIGSQIDKAANTMWEDWSAGSLCGLMKAVAE